MKQVIVVRRNIKMSQGKIVTQACHACLQATCTASPTRLQAWDALGTPKIVLRCDSSAEMAALAAGATELGVPNALVRDAGRTEVDPNTITALAIGPGTDKEINGLTRHLKLF